MIPDAALGMQGLLGEEAQERGRASVLRVLDSRHCMH